MEPTDIVDAPDEYSPYISDYPYIGWNEVMGGGGRNQGQDIYVPPQTNLYASQPYRFNPMMHFGTGVASIPIIGSYLAIPTIAIIVGVVLGYVLRPTVEPHLMKLKK